MTAAYHTPRRTLMLRSVARQLIPVDGVVSQVTTDEQMTRVATIFAWRPLPMIERSAEVTEWLLGVLGRRLSDTMHRIDWYLTHDGKIAMIAVRHDGIAVAVITKTPVASGELEAS